MTTTQINQAAKIGIVLLLSGALYFSLTAKNEELPAIWGNFQRQLALGNGWAVFAALALMPLNWLCEAIKWQFALSGFEPGSLSKSIRGVLAGVAVSIFTPNRIGEIGGRILFVDPENRARAVVAHLLGSTAQLAVIFTAGVAGLTYALYNQGAFGRQNVLLWIIAAALAGATGIWAYFRVDVLRKVDWLPQFVRKRFAKALDVAGNFERQKLAKILGWSVLRYAVYACQYLLLLRFFGIDVSILAGFSGVFIIFLSQTALVLPPLGSLLARGNLAVWVWGTLGANHLSSLAATFALWIINLILPALVGTFLILHVNIAKTFAHENDSH